MYIFATSLLQAFKFSSSDGKRPDHLSYRPGLNMHIKQFKVKITPRYWEPKEDCDKKRKKESPLIYPRIVEYYLNQCRISIILISRCWYSLGMKIHLAVPMMPISSYISDIPEAMQKVRAKYPSHNHFQENWKVLQMTLLYSRASFPSLSTFPLFPSLSRPTANWDPRCKSWGRRSARRGRPERRKWGSWTKGGRTTDDMVKRPCNFCTDRDAISGNWTIYIQFFLMGRRRSCLDLRCMFPSVI